MSYYWKDGKTKPLTGRRSWKRRPRTVASCEQIEIRQVNLRSGAKIMDQLAYIAPWVLASVTIGIIVGMLLGRNRGKDKEPETAATEQRVLLKMLAEVLGAADNIASNVEHHNTELQENVQQVDRLAVSEEMKTIKCAILERMSALLTSNMRLQEDLICTRYRLEEQAQEVELGAAGGAQG